MPRKKTKSSLPAVPFVPLALPPDVPDPHSVFHRPAGSLFAGLKHKGQRAFLAAYSTCHHIERAAKISHMHWSQHYVWMKVVPEYPAWFDYAKEIALDRLESSVFARAVEGEPTPVLFEGQVTAWYRKKSELLTMFMLKGNREKYRDNSGFQFTGPTQINFTIRKEGEPAIGSRHGADSRAILSGDHRREGAERGLRDRAAGGSQDADVSDGGGGSRAGEQAQGVPESDEVDGGDGYPSRARSQNSSVDV